MDKNLGQVFTPKWVVEKMINNICFENETVLEPSCGDGAFLKEIVSYVLNLNISPEEKKTILETRIEAFEIDTEVYKLCITNLDELAKDLGKVNWNIHNEDTLKYDFKNKKYSYIIGNPPYIRLHNLDKDYRSFLKDTFSFCKGTTDIYVAFYEKCINLLSDTGTLIFITPNSFLKNVGFKTFREYVYKNKMLKNLKDFKSSKVFNAATYCAIMTLSKEPNNNFIYEEYNLKEQLLNEEKNIELLNNDKWIFSSQENESFLEGIHNTENFNINVQYGIATLRDKIYITSDFEQINNSTCRFKNHIIETDLIKVIEKGSKIGRLKKTEYCIFPYKENGIGYTPIPEEEMSEKYPLTYKYFLDNKEELLKRDLDKNYISWFQYGRSQGIQNMIADKLVVDPIVNPNGRVKCIHATKDTLVYSGIFITGENLEDVRQILTSPEFTKYITINGKDMQGGFKSLTTKLIKNFINI